ncbi:signal peptidase II [Hydrogenimonas sp. SS33]|uniref:signal peptidase II n=1 Tax=Hydrogenimonas leucolamina TaxID=2954236 RepID=UPI00336BAFBA
MTLRSTLGFLAALVAVFAADQAVKHLFLSGWRWESRCISLHLVFNRGVAFSMFAFLGPWLKWIQLLLLGGVLAFVLRGGYLRRYALPLGMLLGAGLSNIADRFMHGGVVDYVDWHCGFDFAVFNFADVTIDFAVLWILILNFKKK